MSVEQQSGHRQPPNSRGADPLPAPGLLSRLVSSTSVRRRLGLLVAAITIVGLLTGVLITWTAYEHEKASVITQLEGTARAISSALDMQVRELETQLRVLAASPELAQSNMAGFHRLCASVVTNEDTWVVMDDLSGQQVINTRAVPGAKLPKQPATPEEIAAFARGATYASDLFVGPYSQLHVVNVGIPIRSPGVEYNIFIALRPRVISAGLSVHELAPNLTIAIVDRKGTIIARNRGGDDVVGRPATPDMVQAVREKSEGVRDSVTKEGVPVFAAISRSEASDWSVLVGVPRGESLASAHQLLRLAGILAALLLVFAAAISAWIGRSVVRAVHELVLSAQSMACHGSISWRRTGLAETDFVSSALHNTAEAVVDRERQLSQAAAHLEEQVAARTTELGEANQQLAVANRELESFSHMAVHDLREPLRTISGFTSSLRDDFSNELPKEALGYAERIKNAATRMNRLLESIFAYSRVNTPRRELTPVNLNTVLDEVLADLEARFRDTGGRVVAGNLGCVLGNNSDLHQLLLNLIGNALKFRRDGVSPVVEVESGRVGADIHLVVKDNGIGFDPRHAEKIFSPFERLETAKRFEGTGMGLSIVRRIAERLGGSVHATSIPGAGSRFVVILRSAEFPDICPPRTSPSANSESRA